MKKIPQLNKINRNIIILLISNVITLGFTFLAGIISNKTLSPYNFGIFNIIALYTLILQNTTDFGMNINGVKYLNANPSHYGSIIWNIWYTKILLFITFAPPIILLTYTTHFMIPLLQGRSLDIKGYEILGFSTLSALSVIIMSSKSTIDIIQQSRNENFARAISEPTASFIKLILFVFCFLVGRTTILAFIIVTLFSSLSSLIINAFLYKDHIPQIQPINKLLIRNLFISSTFTAMLMVTNYMLGESNKIILDLVIRTEDVGIYSTAQKIFSILTTIPNVIMIPIYSKITQNVNQKISINQIVKKTFFILIFLSLGLTGLIYLGSPLIISILSNKQYAQSIPILKVLSFALPFMFVHHLWGYIMIAKNREKFYFYYSTISLIINIVSCIIFSANYGALGAAYSLILSEFVITILTFADFIRNKNKSLVTQSQFIF